MRTIFTAAVVSALVLGGCNTERLEPRDVQSLVSERFTATELYRVGPDSEALSFEELEAATIAVISEARDSVDVAMETFDSVPVAEALLRAHLRGVRVRVVGDVDNASNAGFERLRIDEGPALRFGDGDSLYTPQPGTDIPRDGARHNRMTHSFILVDERQIVNFSGGLGAEDRARQQVVFVADSIDMGEDFRAEFQQLFGGVFSITLSAFNGPLKTTADRRENYPGTIEDFQLFFGPQERTLKRLIDELFGARASVWLASEYVLSEFVERALLFKARAGFEVRVVLDRALLESSDGSRTSTRAQGIYSRLSTEFASFDNASILLGDGIEGTIAIIDGIRSPINGRRYQTQGWVMSQPLAASIAFVNRGFGGSVGYTEDDSLPADAFTDSNAWVIRTLPERPEPALENLITTFRVMEAGAEQ